ncbi:hypothetical protein Pcac1_g23584 [Phytophthora cactorum]|nr:hypothetical protein Pcac1_g23584 [Phytophthora cactorum]
MTKLVIEHKLTAARFFNMDETSFMPAKKTKTVVAIKGSTNVWSHESKANFHMTVCAAVSAAGTALPPLIIVPGVRILKTDLAAATIEPPASLALQRALATPVCSSCGSTSS